MNLIEKLPKYLYCDDCDLRHFLTLNRTLNGKWTIGYTEWTNGGSIFGINGCSDIPDAANQLKKVLDDYEKL